MGTDKKITVTLNEDGNGFTMHLSTGDAVIPNDQGAYVVSSGCGAGKTRCCDDLISKVFRKGVLYLVDKKVELDKRYNNILEHLDDWGLTNEDVMIISTDKKHNDLLKEYMETPEIIMSKKILLITHTRFFLDFINYFLIYNPTNPTEVKPFTGDFKELMRRDDLRQYILFDETPMFINPFLQMPRSMLASFSNDDGDGGYSFVGRQSMEKRYDDYIKNSPDNPFGDQRYRIYRMKKEIGLAMFEKNYERWKGLKDKTFNVTYHPIQLCQNEIKTHILFLEGAGDILFDSVHRMRMINVDEKYNSTVTFNSFRFGLHRRTKEKETKAIKKLDNWLFNTIKCNQDRGEKSLVVVWMDYATEGSKKHKIDDFRKYVDGMLSRTHKVKENEQKVEKRLDHEYYSVIYFGSDQSKSTNEFRDYKHIILCGNWGVASDDVPKFNNQYGTSITEPRKQLWSYVQLITRIGIREHEGGEFTVWYSDDYSRRFITQLSIYFNENRLDGRNIYPELCPNWLSDRTEFKKLHENHKQSLLTLIKWNETILDELELRNPQTINITLHDIYTLIPRHDRKRGKYKELQKALQTLDLELIID